MRRSFCYTLAALACMTLSDARDAPAQTIPENWDDQGLVVGQIVGTDQYGLATSFAMETKLTVGRQQPDGGVFRGLILFKHVAGEHELRSVYQGAVSLPIGRKFETKKGQITLLGMMFCVPDPQNKREYRIVVFDNTDETLDFIRRVYPAVLAGHADAPVVLPQGNYLPKERLAALRRLEARDQARKTKRQGQFWVAGIAGTLAEVNVTGDSVQVLRFLPPVTYEEFLVNSYDDQGVLTFSSSKERWRVVNGGVEAPTKR